MKGLGVLAWGVVAMLAVVAPAYAQEMPGVVADADGNEPRFLARLRAAAQVGLQSSRVVTPTRKALPSEYPEFRDDLELADMELVIVRQLERFKELSLSGSIQFGGNVVPQTRLVETLEQFLLLAKNTRSCLSQKNAKKDACWNAFSAEVVDKYDVYVPDLKPGDSRFGEDQPVLYTGYYTPHLEVSPTVVGAKKHGIYMMPKAELLARLPRFDIDFRNRLARNNLELFYGDDLFDLYLLQLEGGGRVTYINAQGKSVSSYLTYAGTNRRSWKFISNKMLEQGWISEPTVMEQRRFIQANPGLAPEIFSYCPGYVYFRMTNHPPWGSDQVPLTDNRSIATDYNHYKLKGVLGFVSTHRPVPLKEGESNSMPFTRFVIDQDTGGAIKGKARVDFYFGEGAYAEYAATTLKERGDLYFLVLKDL